MRVTLQMMMLPGLIFLKNLLMNDWPFFVLKGPLIVLFIILLLDEHSFLLFTMQFLQVDINSLEVGLSLARNLPHVKVMHLLWHCRRRVTPSEVK